jgi:hypothetical protein
MRNNTLILSMTLVAAAASSGCRLTANNEPASGTLLVCLFDRSISADGPETKDRYLADFSKLVADLQPGDTVVADAITENPTATMRFPVHIVLPSYDPAQSNPLVHKRELQAAKRTLLEQVGQLVRGTPATKKTAILDALYVTRKVWQSDAGKKAARRTIVVFSDMVEDSAQANFEHDYLNAGRIKTLLGIEEKNSRLPDLKGVDAWVAGATPDRTMGEARIRSIETFWEAYFSRCGAILTPDRYGPALLNFALVKN